MRATDNLNTTDAATAHTYATLQEAFDYFNRELFGGELPDCLITLNTVSKKARGFYYPRKFAERNGNGGHVDEVALNPETFKGRSDEDIVSTLVHEMAHLWQEHNGKPSRNRYHNREWADKMEELGLVPSTTGAPGGKRTGQRVSHYVDPEGAFAKLYRDYFADRVLLRYDGQRESAGSTAKNRKVKYQCLVCEAAAWGKPNLSLVCGDCEEVMTAA